MSGQYSGFFDTSNISSSTPTNISATGENPGPGINSFTENNMTPGISLIGNITGPGISLIRENSSAGISLIANNPSNGISFNENNLGTGISYPDDNMGPGISLTGNSTGPRISLTRDNTSAGISFNNNSSAGTSYTGANRSTSPIPDALEVKYISAETARYEARKIFNEKLLARLGVTLDGEKLDALARAVVDKMEVSAALDFGVDR
ncbi:hypothetical protein M8J77_009860 [Diaphorina citri]|nr:hypothetical protein M8J77_009860 [Diaphorina citri]